LRVATCNLLHGLDVRRGRVDRDGAAEAIAGLDADIASTTCASARAGSATTLPLSATVRPLSADRDRTPTRQ
jgi:hypothetical protein